MTSKFRQNCKFSFFQLNLHIFDNLKVNFKMCKQSQVAEGIVISYFSQKEVNMSWSGEGLLGYFSTCTSSHSSLVKELSMKKRDWHVEKEV